MVERRERACVNDTGTRVTVWGLTATQGVAGCTRANGKNWDKCNRLTVKNKKKNNMHKICYKNKKSKSMHF